MFPLTLQVFWRMQRWPNRLIKTGFALPHWHSCMTRYWNQRLKLKRPGSFGNSTLATNQFRTRRSKTWQICIRTGFSCTLSKRLQSYTPKAPAHRHTCIFSPTPESILMWMRRLGIQRKLVNIPRETFLNIWWGSLKVIYCHSVPWGWHSILAPCHIPARIPSWLHLLSFYEAIHQPLDFCGCHGVGNC